MFILATAVSALVFGYLVSTMMVRPTPVAELNAQRVASIGRVGRQSETRFIDHLLAPLHRVIGEHIRLTPKQEAELRLFLDQAGYFHVPAKDYVISKWVTLLGILLVMGFLAIASGALWLFVMGIALGVYSFRQTDNSLRRKIRERRTRMAAELPDFVDIVLVFIGAGATVLRAIQQATEVAGPTLKRDLQILCAELEAEDTIQKPLNRFAERVGLLEAHNFVTALSQGLTSDPEAARVMYENQSVTMREMRKFNKKKMLRTLPNKVRVITWLILLNIILLPLVASIVSLRSSLQ